MPDLRACTIECDGCGAKADCLEFRTGDEPGPFARWSGLPPAWMCAADILEGEHLVCSVACARKVDAGVRARKVLEENEARASVPPPAESALPAGCLICEHAFGQHDEYGCRVGEGREEACGCEYDPSSPPTRVDKQRARRVYDVLLQRQSGFAQLLLLANAFRAAREELASAFHEARERRRP